MASLAAEDEIEEVRRKITEVEAELKEVKAVLKAEEKKNTDIKRIEWLRIKETGLDARLTGLDARLTGLDARLTKLQEKENLLLQLRVQKGLISFVCRDCTFISVRTICSLMYYPSLYIIVLVVLFVLQCSHCCQYWYFSVI